MVWIVKFFNLLFKKVLSLWNIRYPLFFLAFLISGLIVANTGSKDNGDIVAIYEDFSEDPGWEGLNNRVNCVNCPQIKQDFGWMPSDHMGTGPGEIGGTIWRSTTPAFYAMPIGPFSFEDKLSASGKIAVVAPPEQGFGFYIGFFNNIRQGWRVWSSCGFRIGKIWNGKARFHLDYKTGLAQGAILNPDIEILCDGSVHHWQLTYEPEVTVATKWPDPRLPALMDGSTNIRETEIYERLRQIDTTITREELHKMLLQARDAGLIDHWYRKGIYHLWSVESDVDKIKGRITFRFDDQPAVSYFLIPGHQTQPSDIDRFGVYNMQIYHGSTKFYLSDLIVNGKEIDLSRDPHWDGRNNRISYVQNDFHARQNYGYCQTNWAGIDAGEIGGRFWGTEVIDPLHSFYAADIGKLTLEDPISFSGWINFVEGAVDGRMLLGYFNREARIADIKGEYKGNPPPQFMGVEVMDQTRFGYSFTAVCSPRQDISFENRGPIYIPDRIKRPFAFTYEPDNGKAGRITIILGTDTLQADLTPQQREIGAVFDRFGLLNPRKGGKYVDVYIDDLTYTAKYPPGTEPEKFQQQVVTVPYPDLGRKYK
jgi:hypothetical protein